ncbi:RCC1 domain-containing protein [Cryptosporidium canis]|uniref:RCC1 domain-containing protein n=1 Tax=Cryptosporidium canis TaxID=195482 RepID=A0A9D5DIR4_9CRYT|nr:RCC1 domain-containing protein [Cryptosporidium canis]
MYATEDQSQLPGVPDFIKNEVKKKAFKTQAGDSLGGHTFTRAASSLNHYFVVAKHKNKGQLFAWGMNTNNVLGLGIENGQFDYPIRVNFFSALDVFQVSCGYSHSAVLVKGIAEASGRVYTMGLGDRGRLGYTRGHTEFGNEDNKNDINESWYTPLPCIVNFPFNARISRIACGANHSLALSESGLVFSWGIGQYGCLGTGELNDVYSPVKIVAGPTDKKVLHIAAGARHSLCCNEDGEVFAWGSNSNGRLGTGGSHGMKTVPTQIMSLAPYHVTLVSAGESHSGCIDSFGYIYTWGNGGSGKLGHGTQSDCNLPRRIEGISSFPFVQLTLGAFNSIALSQSGEVYIWGAKQHEIILLPTKIDAFHSSICHISSGPYISFAMDVRHNIYMWNNRILVNTKNSGALNLNEEQLYKRMNSKDPVLLPFFQSKAFVDDSVFYMGFNLVDYKGNSVSYEPKSEDGLFSVNRVYKSRGTPGLGSLVGSQIPPWSVRQIACGASHTLLLVYGGTIFAWGDNKYGQLGVETRRRRSESGEKNESFLNEPTEIKFSEPIRRIACGSWHSLCCDVKGNCFSWGRGDRGQLGTGAIRNLHEPTGIVTLKNVIDVAGGELYSACIAACITAKNKDLDTIRSGDLWVWGDGDLGKLGLGDHVLKSCIAAPRHLNLGVPIIKVALGSSHTLVLTASGELITWGAGYYGRLGTNSTKSHSNPIKIRFPIKGVQIVDIAVGFYHSMAVSSVGDLWVWGKAENVLSEKDVLTPYIFAKLESPSGVPKVYSIHAFGDVSYAITQSGALWVWGPESSENQNAQGLEGGIQIKSHTGRVEMIVLPGNAVGVSGSTSHHVCLLASGEVVSWGEPSRGKLGQSDSLNKKYVQDPALVIPKWNDAKNLLEAVGKGDPKTGLITDKKKNYTKDEGVTTMEELEAFMQELTSSSVHFSKQAKSFEYVQTLLHKEDPRTRKDSISLLEEDLVVLFSSHIDFFKKMKEQEERLRYLTFVAEVQMRRLIGMIQSANSSNLIFIENNYYRNIYGEYFNNFLWRGVRLHPQLCPRTVPTPAGVRGGFRNQEFSRAERLPDHARDHWGGALQEGAAGCH